MTKGELLAALSHLPDDTVILVFDESSGDLGAIKVEYGQASMRAWGGDMLGRYAYGDIHDEKTQSVAIIVEVR